MSVFGRFEDAQLFISATTEPKLKAFLAFAFTTVMMRRGMDPNLSPASEFDMRFFLEAAMAFFADEQAVRAILDGRQDELRWWPEEDAWGGAKRRDCAEGHAAPHSQDEVD